jgi:hypothetical protein
MAQTFTCLDFVCFVFFVVKNYQTHGPDIQARSPV